MVIDDNADQAELLVVLLQSQGYEAHAVLDAAEGLRWAREHLPGLVLVDYAMPDLNGADLGRLLKGAAETAHIKVVIETGISESTVRASWDGYDGFLAKPFFLNELTELVARLLPL